MIAHRADIPKQSTPFITPTKCAALINTNMKEASTKCFGTSLPSSGREKCRFEEPIASEVVHLYRYMLEMFL